MALETHRLLNLELPVEDWAKEEGIADQEILQRIMHASDDLMAAKEAEYGPVLMRTAEKMIVLQILDQAWKEHLLNLDHLRQGIGLRAYGQKDPLNEYKYEAFALFDDMLNNFRETVVLTLSHVSIKQQDPEELERQSRPQQQEYQTRHDSPNATADDKPVGPVTSRATATNIDPNNPETWGRVKRNDPCPCGSGKKFKQCHGKI